MTKYKAVALCRVSTARQKKEGNSLEAQEKYVYECAEYHDATIAKLWSLDTSSKKGKNLARKDLLEIFAYCKAHRGTKYLILDEVDRFMRSVDEYYWWKVEFKRIGTYLAYAKMPEITHQDDPVAVMREMFEVFRSEASNHERITKAKDKMKSRVMGGYYPFYPHQGYKPTKEKDGLHIPDEPRFSMLRTALKSVASRKMTPKEAQLWLKDNGYRTRIGGRVIDMNRWHEILLDPYYMGEIYVPGWDVRATGHHEPMISKEEYEINVAVISQRRVQRKKQFNPDFPLNLALHEPCADKNGKLTGINHTNGKGWYRKEYLCRNCGKRIPQEVVHRSLNESLSSLGLSEKSLRTLKKSFGLIWEKEQTYRVARLEQLNKRQQELEATHSSYIASLAANPDLAEDIRAEIQKNKKLIGENDAEIGRASDIDDEFLEFVEYALGYIENLRQKFWSLPPESSLKCKELLFHGEILVSPAGKVYTPKISPIYSLTTIKKAPENASDAYLVELAGTAPASDW